MPVRAQWWTHCIGVDKSPYFDTIAKALANKTARVKTTGVAGYFIWGDRVRCSDESAAEFVQVEGRDQKVFVRRDALDGEPLLELYVIDVGQGDGLLVVTPEGHNIMIDGGDLRAKQVTGKNAADFVDWKFTRDYVSRADRGDAASKTIALDAVVSTHCDQDHFGGLLDLLDITSPQARAELAARSVSVGQFYHAGLSWWVKPIADPKKRERSLGRTKEGSYTQLIGDREICASATVDLDANNAETVSGSWGRFVHSMVATQTAAGEPTPITRLSSRAVKWLPCFDDTHGESQVAIRVLGPIEQDIDGSPGLTKFGSDSITTNGHSVTLRLDYGSVRLMLTGDLNTASQEQLMRHYDGEFASEFRCEVAKACHHGSADVSVRFLRGMQPLATVISSGDGESHDHPRPQIVSASALSGRVLLSDDGHKLIAPLVYATEIARSARLGDVVGLSGYTTQITQLPSKDPAEVEDDSGDDLRRYRLRLGSDRKKLSHNPRLDLAKVVTGLVYGLVNVRTDGHRLLFALREESGNDWGIETIEAAEIAAATPMTF